MNKKNTLFHKAARKTVREFPVSVRSVVAQALSDAEVGDLNPCAKPLKGFGGAGVIEIVDRFDGCAYRVVYTTKIKDVICVVHAFKKKSPRGSQVPQRDMEVIKKRLKAAAAEYDGK